MQGVGRSSAAHTPPRRRASLLALPGAAVLLSLALVPATEAGAQPDPQRPDHEFDELVTGRNSLTHLFDVSSLPAPEFIGEWEGTTPAITHNLYDLGRHSYQANYEAGLRILDVTGIADGEEEEVAWFDVVPERTATAFGGAWSNYPFFDSRTVLVGGFDGVWVVQPRISAERRGRPRVRPPLPVRWAPLSVEPDTTRGPVAPPGGATLVRASRTRP